MVHKYYAHRCSCLVVGMRSLATSTLMISNTELHRDPLVSAEEFYLFPSIGTDFYQSKKYKVVIYKVPLTQTNPFHQWTTITGHVHAVC
jgi:hypothetical protein